MGRFRQASMARRVAIIAFALYALLLQGFLVASAPAAAFAFPGGISCAQDGSGTSGGNPVHHHGLCCIWLAPPLLAAMSRRLRRFRSFPHASLPRRLTSRPRPDSRRARPANIILPRAVLRRPLIAPAVSRLLTAILFPPLDVTSCLPPDRNTLAAR